MPALSAPTQTEAVEAMTSTASMIGRLGVMPWAMSSASALSSVALGERFDLVRFHLYRQQRTQRLFAIATICIRRRG